jgi:signal transduction histidine kinase/phage shock protein PspC (stress-responsive transcriptional regulator)
MASVATHASPARRLVRSRDDRHIAGVCGGLGRALGVDPLVPRIAFVVGALSGGIGIVVYLVAWALMPEAETGEASAPTRSHRGSVEVAAGVGLLTIALVLTFRAAGVWFADWLVWPVGLLAAGGALLWRQSFSGPAAPEPATQTRWPDSPLPVEPAPPVPAAPAHTSAARVTASSLGAALVIAAGLVFLAATGTLSAARDVLLAVLVAVVVLAAIFAPWITRLARTLTAERAERIRSQERAEMAAHLHDSVLQTLALVQRSSEDPRAVSSLARRQERELRSWLSGRSPDAGATRLAEALDAAAAEVEDRHGVAVEVIAVGDAPLDPANEAVVAAAREAMVNAAKFGGDGPVDVYAEASNAHVHVFVRDRGQGFDPATVPGDRRGVRESIVGRMARHGGRAVIHSAPGAGTEVELIMERS